MRIFGFEIHRAQRTRFDDKVWNPHHRFATRLGDLTPAELRIELGLCLHKARNGGGYTIDPLDVRERLQEFGDKRSLNYDVLYKGVRKCTD